MLSELGQALLTAPLFWPGVTIAAYGAGVRLQARMRGAALAHPVLIAILLVGGLLRASGTSYDDYLAAVRPIHLLLGPATVALAIPLALSLPALRQRWPAVLVAVILGAAASTSTGLLLVRAAGGSERLALSMAPKGATTPIAMALADRLGGVPSITASLAIASGILVAIIAGPVLRLCRISDPAARGLAAGTAGSGVGAAFAVRQGQVEGAFAGLAVGLNGLATAALVGPIEWLFG